MAEQVGHTQRFQFPRLRRAFRRLLYEYYTCMHPFFIHQQQLIRKHQNLSCLSDGPMTSLLVIIQVFILLAEAARPSIFQPDQGTSSLILQDQLEQARSNSNTHLYSTTSQNVTPSDHLPVLPVQSTNLTHDLSVSNFKAKLSVSLLRNSGLSITQTNEASKTNESIGP